MTLKDLPIDKIARFIVDNDLGLPTEIFIDVYKPMAYMLSQLGLFLIGPFFPEKEGSEVAKLLEKEENWILIVNRVKELKAEMQAEEEMREREKKGILERFRRFL